MNIQSDRPNPRLCHPSYTTDTPLAIYIPVVGLSSTCHPVLQTTAARTRRSSTTGCFSDDPTKVCGSYTRRCSHRQVAITRVARSPTLTVVTIESPTAEAVFRSHSPLTTVPARRAIGTSTLSDRRRRRLLRQPRRHRYSVLATRSSTIWNTESQIHVDPVVLIMLNPYKAVLYI